MSAQDDERVDYNFDLIPFSGAVRIEQENCWPGRTVIDLVWPGDAEIRPAYYTTVHDSGTEIET